MKTQLPNLLSDMLEGIRQEVIDLHATWDVYCQLYGHTPERIEILNGAAPVFFRIVQDKIVDSTILALTRLGDGPGSCGHENLTLKRLANEFESFDERDLAAKIRAVVEEIRKQYPALWDSRHKRIAHRDLAKALKYDSTPISGISRKTFKEVLAKIRDLMKEIDEHLGAGETIYDEIIGNDDAGHLVFLLEDARAHQVCKRAAWDVSSR